MPGICAEVRTHRDTMGFQSDVLPPPRGSKGVSRPRFSKIKSSKNVLNNVCFELLNIREQYPVEDGAIIVYVLNQILQRYLRRVK